MEIFAILDLMCKPVIGIVGRPAILENKTTVTIIMENYRQAIIKNGGNPLLILSPQNINYVDTKLRDMPKLTEEEKEMLETQISFCDGILLPGGYKIYEHDYYILNLCIKKDIPVLGICLGMQIITSLENENNIQKIEYENDNIINHCQKEKDYVHKVSIKKDSVLYNILKEDTFLVNSLHNYHVKNSGLYDIVGYSEDGIIEAIENKNNKFNIGVQWHPERLLEDPIQNKLLKEFIKNCKK